MKVKILDHKRRIVKTKYGGQKREEAPSELFIDNVEDGYCFVCRKKQSPPMLAYEPSDGTYSMGICKKCLDDVHAQIKGLTK